MYLHAAVVCGLHGEFQRIVTGILAFGAGEHRAPGQQFGRIQGVHVADYLEDESVAAQLPQTLYLLQQMELLDDAQLVHVRPVEPRHGGEPGAAELFVPWNKTFGLGLGTEAENAQARQDYQQFRFHNL